MMSFGYDWERAREVEFDVSDVLAYVTSLPEGAEAGVGECSEFCLIANALKWEGFADYVAVDIATSEPGTPRSEAIGMARVWNDGEERQVFRLSPELAKLASDFDYVFGGRSVTRGEALAWLTARSR